ncbi:MAG: extracellular solute-binding protein [Sedimenticola sp.]
MNGQKNSTLLMTACRNKLVLLLVLPLLFSCSRDSDEVATAPAEVKQMRLYTSVPLQLIESIKTEFEKHYPGIAIELTRTGTSKIMKQVKNEAEAGKVGADVLWVSDFSNAEELKAQGLLRQYRSPEVSVIFPLFRDAEHYYTGSRLLNMVVAYNTQEVSQPPSSYKALLEPQWKGRIGVVDPEVSGSSMYTLATLVQDRRYGRDYLQGLAKNDVTVVRNNRYMAEMVASGELHAGIVIDFSVRSLQALYAELPIDYLYPLDGTIIIASPIALSRDCISCEAAQTFIDWVLSKPGQTFMSKHLGIMPARTDVPAPKGMPTLDSLLVFPSNPKSVWSGSQEVLADYHELVKPKPKGGE